MKVVLFFTLFFIAGCANGPKPKPGAMLTITEVYPTKSTALMRQNIEHLIQVYDVSPLMVTYNIEIDSRSAPSRSHPTLTLNTRFADQPQKILSVLLHEQLHWWTAKNKVPTLKAIAEIKRLFPNAPREGNLKTNLGTYEHLIVCLLEYDSLIYYLDKKKAQKIILDYIKRDKIYPWSFTKVINHYRTINQIILKYKLKPKILMPKLIQKPTKKPLLSPAKRLKNL